MPARLRLPLALLVCALATAALSLTLWRAEQDDVRDEARERARGTAAALEQRAGAAVLALQGVRAAYDASSSVGPQAFSTYARVPLARPEIVAVGWVPRVAAASAARSRRPSRSASPLPPASRSRTHSSARSRPPRALDVLDLGSDPSLGDALRSARTTGQPRLSAPDPPARRRPDRRLRLRPRLRQRPAAPHACPAPRRPHGARRRRPRRERAGPHRLDRPPRRSRRPRHRRPHRARAGPGRRRDRSRRARRPDLARLARPRLRLARRPDRHRLRRPGVDAAARASRRCGSAGARPPRLRSKPRLRGADELGHALARAESKIDEEQRPAGSSPTQATRSSSRSTGTA